MGRIDELCDERGHIEDLYSELNKWSFESKLSSQSCSFDFASDFADKMWLYGQLFCDHILTVQKRPWQPFRHLSYASHYGLFI